MGLDHRGAHLAVTEQIKRWEKPNIPSHDSRTSCQLANSAVVRKYISETYISMPSVNLSSDFGIGYQSLLVGLIRARVSNRAQGQTRQLVSGGRATELHESSYKFTNQFQELAFSAPL